MNEKTQTLYLKDDRSDKVYTVSVVASGDGYEVSYAYGRRGGTLTTGTKTTSPVGLEVASKLFDKLIREKESKGYSPGVDGTRYASTAKQGQVSAYLPMLLNTVDDAEVMRLIEDSRWLMQPKLDGRRIMVSKAAGRIVGINKLGLEVDLPLPVVEAALAIPFDFVIDGEMIGDRHHAFDVISIDGVDLRKKDYSSRRMYLSSLLFGEVGAIGGVPTWTDTATKAAALAQLCADNAEGAVFKRVDCQYRSGRPSKGGTALKFKFVETCSAVVASVNAKRSVAIQLLNDKAQWVPYGNVAIQPNRDVPDVGAVVEVRYLYAYPGSLYQPLFLGVRDDIREQECLVSKVKFKAGVGPAVLQIATRKEPR